MWQEWKRALNSEKVKHAHKLVSNIYIRENRSQQKSGKPGFYCLSKSEKKFILSIDTEKNEQDLKKNWVKKKRVVIMHN